MFRSTSAEHQATTDILHWEQVFKGTPLEGSDDAISPITKLPGSNIPALVPVPKLERLYFR